MRLLTILGVFVTVFVKIKTEDAISSKTASSIIPGDFLKNCGSDYLCIPKRYCRNGRFMNPKHLTNLKNAEKCDQSVATCCKKPPEWPRNSSAQNNPSLTRIVVRKRKSGAANGLRTTRIRRKLHQVLPEAVDLQLVGETGFESSSPTPKSVRDSLSMVANRKLEPDTRNLTSSPTCKTDPSGFCEQLPPGTSTLAFLPPQTTTSRLATTYYTPPTRPTPRPITPPQTTFRPTFSPSIFQQADFLSSGLSACAAALLCVQEEHCGPDGSYTETPVQLTSNHLLQRAAVVPCLNRTTNLEGVCCRDPHYQDPWPSTNKDGKYSEDPTIGQYYPKSKITELSTNDVNVYKRKTRHKSIKTKARFAQK